MTHYMRMPLRSEINIVYFLSVNIGKLGTLFSVPKIALHIRDCMGDCKWFVYGMAQDVLAYNSREEVSMHACLCIYPSGVEGSGCMQMACTP